MFEDFYESIISFHIEIVATYLFRQELGDTLLIATARFGEEDVPSVVTLLLNAGAVIDAKNMVSVYFTFESYWVKKPNILWLKFIF